ncbi:MAG: apolipoprotein N-acyltransferase [Synechococcales cyanobacterium]
MAVLLTVWGCPEPHGWHHWLGGLLGMAPLWALGWGQSWRRQLTEATWVWVAVCVGVFVPDIGRVSVLAWWEILGGVLVAPLLPLSLVAVTMLGWQVAERCPGALRPWVVGGLWAGWDALWGQLWVPLPLHWGALIYDWPLGIQVADLGQVWAVTGWLVVVNAALSMAGSLGRRGWTAVGLMVAVVLGYGQWRLGQVSAQMLTAPQFQVGTVQIVGWFDDDGSWAYRQQRHRQIQVQSRQLVQSGADLVVWPEGALRSRVVNTWLETELIQPLLGQLPQGGGLLMGASEPTDATATTFINAALLYGSEGSLRDRGGKQWLFPYFESGRFIPDPSGARPLQGGSRLGRLGVLVCLESVLPSPSRQLVQGGAESLLVISDDSWFGNSRWPLLHGVLSVFRAVENRRSVVFVNNTGSNLIVDPTGRIQAQGQLFVRDPVQGTVYRLGT